MVGLNKVKANSVWLNHELGLSLDILFQDYSFHISLQPAVKGTGLNSDDIATLQLFVDGKELENFQVRIKSKY